MFEAANSISLSSPRQANAKACRIGDQDGVGTRRQDQVQDLGILRGVHGVAGKRGSKCFF